MDKEKSKMGHNSLNVSFQKFQQTDNPGIVRAQCRVAYAGENRNYTRISKEAFERAVPSIYNVPVVGNWLGSNFGGHDVILETNGNDVTFKDNTIAYGVVPKDANPRWEIFTDKFGKKTEYFVVDVLLWHERYPEEIGFIADNEGVGQSMEIMVTKGDYDDNYEYFDIEDFYYSALCLLGKDENNAENHVEPCFEDAGVNFTLGDNVTKQLAEFNEFIERSENVDIEKNKFEEDVQEDIEETEEVENEEVEETQEVEGAEEETSNDEVDENNEAEDTEEEASNDELEEVKAELKRVQEENQNLKDELAQYKAKEEEDAKEELFKKYSVLLDEEILDEYKAKDISSKQLSVELAVAFSELAFEKATVKKESKVVASNRFAIASDDEEVEDGKDKFAIK